MLLIGPGRYSLDAFFFKKKLVRANVINKPKILVP